jgi:omega-hydroxy-beta-dihydromenaquinone-9 sulfotransferase
MIQFLRLLLALSLVHPFEGITFGDWMRLLRRERFRISPLRWPRALWITAFSLLNSILRRRVERKLGPAIGATQVKAPVFILGHYRSGTTHLHELLAHDPRFASPSRFQTFNASTFLTAESWLKPIVEPFMLPRQVQEDEVAYMVLCQLSPYMDWCFPRSRSGYGRYLTFENASAEEVADWSRAIEGFLKALTIRYNRPLILKSPPHTARMKLLLQAFPDARFVHIRRNPYAVYVSTVNLLKAVNPVFRLQSGPWKIDEGYVLQAYRTMYEAYFADRALVPAGQLVEIAYEDLDRDPLGQLEMIYQGLSMGDFAEVRPAMEKYLGTIANYQKNRYRAMDAGLKQRIAEAWSQSFDVWGYQR